MFEVGHFVFASNVAKTSRLWVVEGATYIHIGQS